MGQLLIKRLAAALHDRGLAAEPAGADMLRAANRAAEPPPGNSIAVRMSPGLRQQVACRTDAAGRLMWWWVWPGPTRDAPPEYEPLGPAEQVEAAADKIAGVLKLNDV